MRGIVVGSIPRAVAIETRPTVDPEVRTARLDAERRLLEAMRSFGGEPAAFHVHTSDTITPEAVGGLPVRRNPVCPPGQVFLFDAADDAEATREARAAWVTAKGNLDV